MFSFNGPLWRGLTFIGDVVVMHFLWLLCCLPVFTIGASTTALYYAAMKRIRTDEGSVSSNFFRSFKQNFRQSTIYWLLILVAGVVLYFDLNFTTTYDSALAKVLLVGCVLLTVLLWMTLLYLFPVQAKFESSLLGNLRNAFLLSVRHLPYTLLLTVIWAMVWLLLAIFPPFTGLLIICGGGLLACFTAPIYIQIFRKYIPDELERDLEARGDSFFRGPGADD